MEVIQTERLILRPPVLEDAAALLPIRNSDFVFAFNPMKPMSEAQMREDLDKGRERMAVLEKKEDNTVIGAFFWSEDKLRYRVAALCLSYYLAQQESGKGYMTETLRKMTEQLFLQGTQVLSLRCYKENIASAKVAEKSGFVHEGCIRCAVLDNSGVLHDDCIYSLTREEYQTGGR